jgi:hypothetical protein
VSKGNPFKDLESLRQVADVVTFPQAKTKRSANPVTKSRKFAHVPLEENWGYQVMRLAGAGGGIVLHALYVQRTTGRGEVPITTETLNRCGVSKSTRLRTLRRLVKAGMATVRYRGPHRGCPLLTLHIPPG